MAEYPVLNKAPDVASAVVPHVLDSNGNAVPAGGESGVALTKGAVTMSGSSGVLVAADATRKIVIVGSTAGNAAAAIDPTGGTAALDAGIPMAGGDVVKIFGKAAQSAMTQIGTNGQKLTVYTG